MQILEIDTTILALFKSALLSSHSQINDLLTVQQFLGLRKKSENWTIYLSNYFIKFYGLQTSIKKNAGGYQYAEMILKSPDSDVTVICNLQYLKKRDIFPRPAIYRDVQRAKNPSMQQEFAHPSFRQPEKQELYYLFCFGEDEEGLFGIFRQPDGYLAQYYAESKNCIYNTDEVIAPVNEQPDSSVFGIKLELINKFSNKEV